MFYIKSCRQLAAVVSMVVTLFLGLAMHIPFTQVETTYDITNCCSGTITYLYRSEELTIFATDLKGIAVSNNENKVFDNCSFHSAQIIQIMNGKWKHFGVERF